MRHPISSDDAATITRLRDALDELVDDLPAIPNEPVVRVRVATPGTRLDRRRRFVFVAASVATGVTLLGAFGIVSNRDDGTSEIEAGPPSDASPVTEPHAFADGGTIPTYDLVLDAAQPVREETLTARGTDAALWGDAQTQTFLSLTVRSGLASAQPEPAGMGPMTEDLAFPSAEGRAWFGSGAHPQSLSMWWTRADGDVWLLRAHWYGSGDTDFETRRDEMREWALAVERSGDGSAATYTLNDAAMQLLAVDHAGERASRARVWSYDEEEIVLLVIEDTAAAQHANLLAQGPPEPVTVAGRPGAMVRTPLDTVVGWQPDPSNEAWATLTIPAAIADRTPQILAALDP